MCSIFHVGCLRSTMHITYYLMLFSMLKLYLNIISLSLFFLFFFLNDTAPPEISTLPLHDALPIFHRRGERETGRPGLDRLFRQTRPLGLQPPTLRPGDRPTQVTRTSGRAPRPRPADQTPRSVRKIGRAHV